MTLPLAKTIASVVIAGAVALAPGLGRAEPFGPEQLARSPLAQALGDPVTAARRAVAQGDFGLIWGATLGSSWAFDVTCLAPMSLDPQNRKLVAGEMAYSDEVGPDSAREGEAEEADAAFGQAYNAVVLASRRFPYSDVCRRVRAEDISGAPYHPTWALAATSRRPPITSLATAARLGSLKRVNAFLRAGAPVDERDAFGLSPLAWALIRGHDAIALRLLRAGASRQGDVLLYAVAFGRDAVLRQMWTADVLENARDRASALAEAAVYMDHPSTLLALQARTKATFDADTLSRLLWVALRRRHHVMAEVVLHRLGGEVPAADLFIAAVETGDMTYVEKALRLGADPNGIIGVSDEPALYYVANSLSADTAPAVARRLIRAGASEEKSTYGDQTAMQALMRFGFAAPANYRRWVEPAYRPITSEGRRQVARVLKAASHSSPPPDQVR